MISAAAGEVQAHARGQALQLQFENVMASSSSTLGSPGAPVLPVEILEGDSDIGGDCGPSSKKARCDGVDMVSVPEEAPHPGGPSEPEPSSGPADMTEPTKTCITCWVTFPEGQFQARSKNCKQCKLNWDRLYRFSVNTGQRELLLSIKAEEFPMAKSILGVFLALNSHVKSGPHRGATMMPNFCIQGFRSNVVNFGFDTTIASCFPQIASVIDVLPMWALATAFEEPTEGFVESEEHVNSSI